MPKEIPLEVKPCPFCSSPDVRRYSHNYIYCSGCTAEFQQENVYGNDLIRNWNRVSDKVHEKTFRVKKVRNVQ